MPFDCCSIMLVGKAFGQFLCQEREVIWEGETLALACESAREPSRIIVTLAARDTLPAGNHRFFDGHCAIEIRDEMRNVGVEHMRIEDDELPFLVHVHVAEKVRDDIK